MSDSAHWYLVTDYFTKDVYFQVIGYALLGAVVFRAVEGPHEMEVQRDVTTARHRAVDIAWNATFRVNKLDRSRWEETVYSQVGVALGL